MGRLRLDWDGGLRFTGVDSWGHHVTIEADPAGAGVKPSDMVPLALAACTAYDLVNILRKQRQDLRGLEADITAEQDPDPPWAFRRIVVHYTLRGEVDPSRAQRALELSEQRYCSVAATLRPTVSLELSVEVAPPAASGD